MKINVKVLSAARVQESVKIADLDEKRLVPKMMLRRRLTRAGKLFIYLADRCGFTDGPIVYGSAFGELQATADIVGAIAARTSISPTAFQNSVYNTAPSYFSILQENRHEILTLSSGRNTSRDVLSTAALQSATFAESVLMLCTETMDIPGIDEVNSCSDYLEIGAACRIELTDEAPNVEIEAKNHDGFPPSMWAILDLIEACEGRENPVVALEL